MKHAKSISDYSALEQHLLNDFQRDMSLSKTPFARMANRLDVREDVIIDSIKSLQDRGAISRIGPVFRPNTVGVSTLAAMALPDQELVNVARIINNFAEVNHNYQRDHKYNLWFVVTASSEMHLEEVLYDIEQQTDYPLMSLPMLKDYFIDLSFNLINLDAEQAISGRTDSKTVPPDIRIDVTSAENRTLIAAVGNGLPIVNRPYAKIARELNTTESEVISRLQQLMDNGSIKRYGVVVRHKELGYTANGMVVWDVPETRVDELGTCIGKYNCVTLSYQRPRQLPQWPYNLFTMVHGRHQQEVIEKVAGIALDCGLQDTDHTILFSTRRFKQRGAQYSQPTRPVGDTGANPLYTKVVAGEFAGESAPGLTAHSILGNEFHQPCEYDAG